MTLERSALKILYFVYIYIYVFNQNNLLIKPEKDVLCQYLGSGGCWPWIELVFVSCLNYLSKNFLKPPNSIKI